MREFACFLLLMVSCAEQGFSGGESEAEAEGEACGSGADGAVRCTEGGFQRCRDGDWVDGVCDGECADGRCTDNACPDGGRTRCGESGTLDTCFPDVGGWEISACPDGTACAGDVCAPIVCPAGGTFCDGDDARQCDETGTRSDLIETCTGAEECMNGACLGACDVAESEYSFIGCKYYALDTDNNTANDPLQYDIVVGNPSVDTAVTVTIDQRTGGTWSTIYTTSVAPRGGVIIPTTCTGGGFGGGCQPGNLGPDLHPEDTTIAAGYAFRVESNVPIFAYQFNSDDLNGSASSSGATILMPEAALDNDYYALTLPQTADERGWVAVVGMQDGTSVQVRVAAPTVAGGGIAAYGAGESLPPISLDEGDVLQVASASAGDDLSGTYVSATNAVAVFAGHECAGYGGQTCASTTVGTDHVEEQMIPITTWGKEFIAARVRHPQQATSNTVTWKIVAWKDDTTLEFESAGSVTGLPPGPVSLGVGGVAEVITSGEPGHFLIHATEAVLVEQFTHTDPVGILVVPQEQWLPDYVFSAPPFFQDSLTVARPAGIIVNLDDVPIAGTWNAAGGGFEVLWRDALEDGTHTVGAVEAPKGATAGIQLIGLDINCSYGYLGGLNAERINPIE